MNGFLFIIIQSVLLLFTMTNYASSRARASMQNIAIAIWFILF